MLRLAGLIRQEELILTAPSAAALSTRPPKAVFIGIGVCGRAGVTVGPPFDVLAMLLVGAHIARVAAAPLCVLIADRHAVEAGALPRLVEARTEEWIRVVTALAAQPGFPRTTILRACELHETAEHRFARRVSTLLAPTDAGPYCRLQIADVLSLQERYGSLLKVGWALGSKSSPACTDELLFDAPLRRWPRERLGFIYTRAGRALDDRQPRVPPYIALNPSVRLLLRPQESPIAKLRAGAALVDPQTLAGVRNHLKAITRLWSRTISPLHGSLEARIDDVYGALFSSNATSNAPTSLGQTRAHAVLESS